MLSWKRWKNYVMNNQTSYAIPPSDTSSSVAPSQTVEIGNLARSLAEEGRDIISLSVGEPDFAAPDEILEAGKRAFSNQRTNYTDSSGLPELREYIADKYNEYNKIPASPEDIIVTCGAKHAMFLALQAVVDPGDRVLIPSPYWVSYPAMVRSIGAEPVFVETNLENDYRVRPEDLDKNLQQSDYSAFILNSPANPTGTVYESDDLKQLSEVLKEHRLPLISDEIYEYFTFNDRSHVSIASLGPEIRNRTITISGFSKVYGITGLRVGYATGPKSILDVMKKLQSHSTTHTASTSQYAALAARDVSPQFLTEKCNLLQERSEEVVNRLEQREEVQLSRPGGAMYVFPEFPFLKERSRRSEKKRSVEFCRSLLEETGVATVPGIAFGNDAGVRISLGTSLDSIREALHRMESFLDTRTTE